MEVNRMINWALYKREMKGNIKLLVIFGAIITMYVSIIISTGLAFDRCFSYLYLKRKDEVWIPF